MVNESRQPVTRGFLFSDLRDYTSYVERNGAAAAADLLDRYRALVRSAVGEHNGAEIRTEGDSFYVVFPSISQALTCGLAIVDAAGRESIPVGIGIHAGETLETAEGYVGSQVNIAARLCALAAPGEILVSETVRALTQSLVSTTFVPRGRRRLKGIAEPVAIFAAQPSGSAVRRRPTRLTAAIVGVIVLIGVIGAGVWFASRPPAGVTGSWKLGLSFPFSGAFAADPIAARNAIQLAIDKSTGSALLGGATLSVDARDDATADDENPDLAKQNTDSFVADPTVVAMLGPWHSEVAKEVIPITNAAGVLQCSPTNTDPGLTKPEEGALLLRSPNPTRINYIRIPADAAIESRAGATFAMNDLGAHSALVIDDTQVVGRLVADAFAREYGALGGQVVRRALNPDSDPAELMPVLDGSGAPDMVYFGGFTASGAPDLRRAMNESGHADMPLLGWDGWLDGAGSIEGSFINQTGGSAAANTWVTHPSVGTIRSSFERDYRAAFGDVPSLQGFEYAAAAYACAEIIAQSLAASSGGTPTDVRESVRSRAVSGTFDTVIGHVGFDGNGDSLLQVVSLYRVDPNAAGGLGDWVLVKQQDFGPGG